MTNVDPSDLSKSHPSNEATRPWWNGGSIGGSLWWYFLVWNTKNESVFLSIFSMHLNRNVCCWLPAIVLFVLFWGGWLVLGWLDACSLSGIQF